MNAAHYATRVALWLSCLASFAAPQQSWAAEPLSPDGWRQLTRSVTTPTAVVFSASYCPTCPLAIKALADHRAQRGRPLTIATVALDYQDLAEEDSSKSRNKSYGGVDVAMYPVPTAVALRYAVSPKWRGETPMVALLRPKTKPRLVLGIPADKDLNWLSSGN